MLPLTSANLTENAQEKELSPGDTLSSSNEDESEKASSTRILKLFYFNNATHTHYFSDTETLNKLKTKFENDSPNEFTSGYSIRPTEIIFIFLILLLWAFSLRKFLKNFDKLRITHYREITHKYQIHEPQNINQIRVCNKPTDSVIHSRDPIKRLSLYPRSPEVDKKSLSVKDLKAYDLNEKLSHTTSVLSLDEGSSRYSSVEASPNLRHYQSIVDGRRLAYKVQKIDSLEPERNCNLLDPNVIPPLVRSSLLDLHRRSMENLSVASNTSNATSHLFARKENAVNMLQIKPCLVQKDSLNSNDSYMNKKKSITLNDKITIKFSESSV